MAKMTNCPGGLSLINGQCANPSFAASALNGESAMKLLSVVMPLALGLLVGMWLGKQQSRQKKSFVAIITTWLSSVVSITKFWVKFRVSSVTQSSSGPKKHVVVQQTNGGTELKKNYVDTPVESGVDVADVPKHVAVIMDGNRRFGKRMYGKGSMGHFDGGQKSLQVIEWLSTEGVKFLTLYAFSTENWNRESDEIDTLMGLFLQFVEDDLRPVVFNRKVRVRHICTDESNIPPKLHKAINDLCDETAKHPEDSLTLNVCLSYGSRGEIVHACRNIAQECASGKLKPADITEDTISQNLLTSHSVDPDVLIRTSGEERISNFLLWQLAYTELFFLEKDWPELEKEDFLKVIRTFAKGRQRRFGK
jgi:undecaprenyl diphosphate synthase